MDSLNNVLKSNKYQHILDDINQAKSNYIKYRQEKINVIENIITTNIQSNEFKKQAKKGNKNIIVYNQPQIDKLCCNEIIYLLNKKDHYPIKFHKKLGPSNICQIYVKLVDE